MRGLAAFIGFIFLGPGLGACVPMDGGISAIPEPGETLAPLRGGQRIEAAIAPGEDARPPSGYLAFCARTPEGCKVPKGAPSRIALTGETR